MEKEKLKYFCIFGGGAIRGVAYVGAAKALEELGIEILGYAGSSVGSIFATMYSLGYSVEEMAQIFMNIDYALFKDINFSFKIELALSKGEVFTDWMRKIVGDKMGTDKPVYFRDLKNDLYILTSNLTDGKSVVFSKETTPDFEVAQAVRISSGFPGLMNPYEQHGDYFVDGDLAKSWALSQISQLLNPKDYRILEFRLEGAKNSSPTKNPLEYMNNAINFLCNTATDNVLNLYSKNDRYDFIVLDTKDVFMFDLNLPKEKRQWLIEMGYNTTLDFFENKLPKKKKELLELYSEILTVVEEANSDLKHFKYFEAQETLSHYMVLNYPKFDILNSNIIDLMNECVDLLTKGVSKRFLFGSSIKNKTLIVKKMKLLQEQLHLICEGLENYINA